MRYQELNEAKKLKLDGLNFPIENIYVNPTAREMIHFLNTSYVVKDMKKDLADSGIVDINSVDWDEDVYHEYLVGEVHDPVMPFRGTVNTDGDLYVVDSYDASHADLNGLLPQLGEKVDIHISFKITKTGYVIDIYPTEKYQKALNTRSLTRLKLPIVNTPILQR